MEVGEWRKNRKGRRNGREDSKPAGIKCRDEERVRAIPSLQLMGKNPPAETWIRSLGVGRTTGEGKGHHSVFWPGDFRTVYGVAKSDTNGDFSLSLCQ